MVAWYLRKVYPCRERVNFIAPIETNLPIFINCYFECFAKFTVVFVDTTRAFYPINWFIVLIWLHWLLALFIYINEKNIIFRNLWNLLDSLIPDPFQRIRYLKCFIIAAQLNKVEYDWLLQIVLKYYKKHYLVCKVGILLYSTEKSSKMYDWTHQRVSTAHLLQILVLD